MALTENYCQKHILHTFIASLVWCPSSALKKSFSSWSIFGKRDPPSKNVSPLRLSLKSLPRLIHKTISYFRWDSIFFIIMNQAHVNVEERARERELNLDGKQLHTRLKSEYLIAYTRAKIWQCFNFERFIDDHWLDTMIFFCLKNSI